MLRAGCVPIGHLDPTQREIQRLKPPTAGLASDCRMGLRWYFCCRCPISKLKPVMDSSAQITQDMYFGFFKSQNELVWPFLVNIAASPTSLQPAPLQSWVESVPNGVYLVVSIYLLGGSNLSCCYKDAHWPALYIVNFLRRLYVESVQTWGALTGREQCPMLFQEDSLSQLIIRIQVMFKVEHGPASSESRFCSKFIFFGTVHVEST